MKQTVEAIYENGALRLLQPGVLSMFEGQRVRIVINDDVEPEPLRLAAHVYDGLSEQEIDEIEGIALDRGNFFGTRSAD